ncbi:MAG: imidazoleglycerol-phosphate dehydratase HisB [Pelagibacterales bacterium]|jgi:imidazoleglycerol-phosphate dehydratase|nr:imidazoleglycerol-phosphate dehydratase HisB [Pelagibacterales bacterium]|tara:strand:- start:4141 stop:4734 length:594 start_codon:yes stop_codon:yes gene_type:complete
MKNRIAKIKRITKETQIEAEMNLDGDGNSTLKADIPFLEHMLEQVARHGMFDLNLHAKGDLHIDAHHTVEDIGIVLGQVIDKALGNKTGISRFGSSYVPLDESLSRVVLDFSGRPGLEYNVSYPRSHVGEFDVELLHEFFQGFVNHAKATIHIDNLRGSNSHHIAETIFKAFGKALKAAVSIDPRQAGKIPSTKEII